MISAKDEILLKGTGSTSYISPQKSDNTPNIIPNSEYDDNVTFPSSSSSSGQNSQVKINTQSNFGSTFNQPGEYSPRPTQEEVNQLEQFTPLNNNGNLQSFEINFNDPNSTSLGTSNFKSSFGLSNPKFGNNDFQSFPNSGLHEYSPRPGPDTSFQSPPQLVQLFGMLSQFQPPPLEISPHFKPFLPDLIPSVGQIDAFIKVPRPDGAQDPLGLTVLDEPTIGQANPQILRMQLREKFGVVGGNEGDGFIGIIEDAVHNEKALTNFIDSYDEMTRSRAAPTMTYNTRMPDIEQLMEEFPPELVSTLQSASFPSADIDMSLTEYAQTICAMLDIPVRGNIIESLHLVFSLYDEFQHNVYFNENQNNNNNSRGSTPQ